MAAKKAKVGLNILRDSRVTYHQTHPMWQHLQELSEVMCCTRAAWRGTQFTIKLFNVIDLP